MIELRIPAVPVAQPRVKASRRGNKTTVYTPTKIKNADGSKKDHPIVAFKATVRMAFERRYSGAPLEGALRVDCCFVMPRPQRLLGKKDPDSRIPHESKPDRDNLDKAVLDALKGLMWTDDCQASVGLIEKWYAAREEAAHVVIRVFRWNQQNQDWE